MLPDLAVALTAAETAATNSVPVVMVVEVLPTYEKAVTRFLIAFWLRAEGAAKGDAATMGLATFPDAAGAAAGSQPVLVEVVAVIPAATLVAVVAERRTPVGSVASVARAPRGPVSLGVMERFTTAATAARRVRVAANAVTMEAAEEPAAATTAVAVAEREVVLRAMAALAAAVAVARRT